MEHAYLIGLAESNGNLGPVSYLIGFLVVVAVGGSIAAIYSIKSNERIRFEEERTKQKTIEAVSEGKLSMEDAEKLLKPEKKPWWKR